jgi:transposase
MAATAVEKAFCVLELSKTNSVNLVQRHFRRRYGKPPPTRQSIYDWSTKLQETGCLYKGKSSGRPPVSEKTVERLRETFTRTPRKSTTRASVELFVTSSYELKNMYYKTMQVFWLNS